MSVKLARAQYCNTFSLRSFRYEYIYIIHFYTYPGNDLFQAIVFKDVENMFLLNGIDRLHDYGNQSSCNPEIFDRPDLHKYCFVSHRRNSMLTERK